MLRIALLIALAVALLTGCSEKVTAPPTQDQATVTIGQYTLPSTGTFRDMSQGDPTGDDTAVYGRYYYSKVRRNIIYEAPSGCLIDIIYDCGSYGPYPAGTGSICQNSSGGYDVFYSDCM